MPVTFDNRRNMYCKGKRRIARSSAVEMLLHTSAEEEIVEVSENCMDVILSRYNIDTTLDWCYGGVNETIPGNGGPACANFLSPTRRFWETIFGCIISLLYFFWGYMCIAYPTSFPFVRKDRGGKRLLLVIVSMTLGIEIGFKFGTKQLIYLLNPCHVTTAVQIYLLAAPPSKFVTAVFRVHFNFLNGAVLAILFPVTNARLLPFETEIYWVQHSLLLVTPYYLLRLGGVYTVENLQDFSWSLLSVGIQLLYHFLPLQLIGLATQVNLNNMLCPAISDPFYGPNYRLAAVVHQSLCIPLVAKSFCFVADFFITKFGPTKIKDHLETDVTISSYESYVSALYSLHPADVTPTIDLTQLQQARPHRNGVHAIPTHLHRRSKSESIPEAKEDHLHED